MSQPLTPPTPPPPPAQPQKRSPMFWVAIGCGVIVLLGLLAMGTCGWFVKKKVAQFEANPALAAAELAVRANPDMEVVESDTDKGTITVRNKKTGEVVTWNAADIESGKWSVETDEGTATFGGGGPQDLPAWVPVYPGGSVTGNFDTTSAEGRTVAFTMTTPDTVAAVLEFYESQLQSAGLTVQKSTFDQAGTSGGTVGGTSQDEKRSASVMVSTADGQTSAVVSFTEKP